MYVSVKQTKACVLNISVGKFLKELLKKKIFECRVLKRIFRIKTGCRYF
jgi:hypothetical protein